MEGEEEGERVHFLVLSIKREDKLHLRIRDKKKK